LSTLCNTLRMDDIPESEARVLALLAEGKTNQDIADSTGLALSSVKTYVGRLFLRTQTENRVELARWYLAQTAGAA
jgi:DNA-binding NarL/FixJ family response regulator